MFTAFIAHPDCARHDSGAHHPECPERLSAIQDRLIESGLWPLLRHYEAPLATDGELTAVHSAAHLKHILEVAPRAGLHYLDEDTAMSPGTVAAARRAAGAVRLAVDLVYQQEARNAFCSVRPPGHHAERDRAMGFCFFNNVAVGVAHALKQPGIERVAVLDFDVHHGNGTEQIFQHSDQVLFLSTFQYPFYPFTDINFPADNIVHGPLPAGSDGAAFREMVERRWLPHLRAFKPQMLFISAGFDGHKDDIMAHMGLVEADYRWITEQACAAADTHAQGRIVSVLEGGYELPALARSVEAHLRVLGGFGG
ncbi:MAG: histone deacetylase family protein [Pseudomonadota bacterium]|nr:histone deacetylase family protein [Pseudomonadota bacterium]